MKYQLYISLIVLLFAGCSAFPSKESTRKNIIGVWQLMDYGYGNYSYSILGFTPDGRKCVISLEMDQFGSPVVDYYLNSWLIEGNMLVTIVGNSPSSSLPKGYIIKDEIKAIDVEKMDLIMRVPSSSDPRLERHKKLYAEKPERICEVVKNFADSERSR
ncbi:MAG: hypothetical protein U5M23_07165 [Marinagarivorans sp.]|nr:hypothetical protein [Marinagarivorans sp.]